MNNAELIATAPERIRKHRVSPVELKIVRPDGEPAANAKVHVRLERHAFRFGANAFNLTRIEDAELQGAYNDRFTTLLVQGTTIAPLLRRLGLTSTPDQKYSQYRSQAQLYALRAGQHELNRLHREGILTRQAHQAMSAVYEQDQNRLNTELRDLLYDYPELEQAMILQARRDLLQAERTALSDAARRGLIPEDVYHELILETDNRLAAVEVIEEAMADRQERE